MKKIVAPLLMLLAVHAVPRAARADEPREANVVRVSIEGSDGVVLEEVDGPHRCPAPCGVKLPVGTYRIAGDGVRPSRTFKLAPSGDERVTLTVNAGSKAGFVGGLVSTSVGGGALVVGAVLVLSSLRCTAGGFFQSTCTTAEGPRTAGYVSMLIGAVAVAVGVPTLVANARTKVTFPSEVRDSPDRTLPTRRPDAARDRALDVPMPEVSVAPLFGGTF